MVLAHLQKEVVFAGLRWIRRFRENGMPISIAPDANSCGWHIGARVKKLEVKTS